MSRWLAALSLLCAAAAGAGAGAGARAGAQSPPDERRSGATFMSPQTQAMQADDDANPATLWALDGEALWNAPAGSSGKACASCHGDARASMAGVAARYPAFDTTSGRPIDLAGKVNQCRRERQGAPPLAPESHDLLALTAFVARQSRGLPIAPSDDARLRPFAAEGEALWRTRQGQLNLSCAQCHDANWGRSLGGSPIPQAHPTGYPLYRLEWQAVGSLQRRMRGCLAGVRAEAYPFDAPEWIAVELFLMRRAAGMPMDAPAVRP